MIENNEEAKIREEELKDRASRDTIVHETIPGEDVIRSGGLTDKEKAARSTVDEDTN